MNEITFSIILYVDNLDTFFDAFSHYINKQRTVKVQLIVIDPFADNAIANFCNSDETNLTQIQYLSMPAAEMAEGYQSGLEMAEGEYVNFALSTSYFSENIFESVKDAFIKYPVNMISAKPIYIDLDNKKVQYEGSFKASSKEVIVNLMNDNNVHKIQLLLQAYFFKRECLENISFHKNLQEDATYEFLLQVQLKKPEYLFLSKVVYYYTTPLEDDHSRNAFQYRSHWYQDSVTGFIIPLLKSAKQENKNVPQFLQVACYYLIFAKFQCNLQDRDKGILNDKEKVENFFQSVYQALVYIDNTIIFQKHITDFAQIDRSIRLFMLRGKASVMNKQIKLVDINSKYIVFLDNIDNIDETRDADYQNRICLLSDPRQEKINITVINYKNGMIDIDATLSIVDFFSPEEYEVYAECIEKTGNVTIYQPNYTQIYPLRRMFGITYLKKRTLQFHIPVDESNKQTIRFYYTYDGKVYQFKIGFTSFNSRIFAEGRESYWMFKKGWMLRPNSKKTEIIIEKCSRSLHIKKELRFWQGLYNNKNYVKIRKRGIFLRLLFWLTQSFYDRKNIWVTFDKLYKAGDNGEYLFNYIRKNHEEVDIYYIIRKDSPDYKRLVKQHKRHILIYGTLRCQLIFLQAKIILDTHANISAQFNPDTDYKSITKDLLKGDVICVQHGLSIQKIAQYQNRTFDNIQLYCCASPYEIQNLSQPIYGYAPEQLKLVGLARYDGLKNRDKKIILIAPTWRRNIVNSSVANIKKTHNENFKESDYFRIYNRLINDDTLLDCAKQYNYRIVYLLHPAVSSQIDDFTHNDFVEILQGADLDYEDILCESSLMITDYSGVQFDFAYMRKPLIYYHPAELPPHYEEGGLIYDTMGFGPICKEHDALVNTICEMIKQNCHMDEKYVKRADDFFAYNDHENCKRIFDTVQEYVSNK